MNEQFQLENERIRCKMNDNFKTININYILKDGKKWTACERWTKEMKKNRKRPSLQLLKTFYRDEIL